MLTPREIIAKSWAITTTEPALKRWGFFGSFFEILLDIKLIIYQIYFLESYLNGGSAGLFDIEIYLYHAIPPLTFWTLIGLFLLLVIVELFVPSLSGGAIIGLSAKAHNKEPRTGGLVLALYNFFPILEFHGLFIFSSIPILITAISIVLRYGSGLQSVMVPVIIVVWVISNILKFFSSFTEPGIVVGKLGVFQAGAKSIKLIVSYLPHVIFLALLLAVISLRIFANMLIITLIPAIMIGGGVLLTYFLSPAISYTIAGLIGLTLTVVAAYFFAYLHIFKQAVWTIMYMELIQEKEMDKIG